MTKPKRNNLSLALHAVGCLLLLAVAATAQDPEARRLPAGASGGRGRGAAAPALVSPEVAQDRRVTFRLRAPNATTVVVNGEWTGGNNLAMTRNDSGVWSVVTAPIAPESYFYTFSVDGVRLNDPGNPRNNVLFIPGPESAAFAIADIPHGDLRQVWYTSPTMKEQRRMLVYTPPGYDTSKETYPVLYLLHGWGGDEEEWTNAGYTPEIMDHLLADKKIKPMIVVMPNGHPNQQAAPRVMPTDANSALPSPQVSEMHTRLSAQGMMDDIVPFVEAHYRVKKDRESRAIAGLSMGGEQATYIGLNHLDKFAWVGSFSGAFVMLPGPPAAAEDPGAGRGGGTAIGKTLLEYNFPKLSASNNAKLRLFYISCGTDDSLIKANRDVKDWLKSKDVKFVEVETPGYAHVWRYWRISLLDFAPRLFR